MTSTETMIQEPVAQASCGNTFHPEERAETEWLWPCGYPTGVPKSDKDGVHVPCHCMLPAYVTEWMDMANIVIVGIVEHDGGWGLDIAGRQCAFCEAVSGEDDDHRSDCLVTKARSLTG